jgi:flagellar basal body-associated protein FliL
MAEEKTESAPAAAAPASDGGNKMVTILTIVNLVATMSMVAILFISFQKNKKPASVEDISTHEAHEAGGHGEEGKKEGGHGEGGHGEGKEAGAKKSSQFGKMVTLEQFTVNLSSPGSVNPKFVRVNISLEVPTDDSENELTQKMPQVRNTVIDLFNSKRPADLATAEGRDYLKEEIKNALNSFMVTGKIKGVFFTNFAVSG